MASTSMLPSESDSALAPALDVQETVLVILGHYFADVRFRAHFFDISAPVNREQVESNIVHVVDQIISIFTNANLEQRVECLKRMVSLVSEDYENGRGSAEYIVRRIVLKANQFKLISLKLACEVLINIVDFKLRGDSAISTFDFLLKNLDGLDYKGVRDVLKHLLEKVQQIPVNLLTLRYKKLAMIEDVILEICDRNKNHLPAYFVMNELQRISGSPQPYRCFTIPRLASKFSEILSSFRPLAELTCPIGRPFMVPVAGHIGLLNSSVWKLDHHMKLMLKGLLPLSNDFVTAQSYTIYQVLMQPHGWELLSNHIISISRQNEHRQRSNSLYEELLAMALVEGMVVAESVSHTDACIQYRWRHLTVLLVRSMVQADSNTTRFLTLLKCLHKNLCTVSLLNGRDDLMWALLQYIGGCLDKLSVDELLAVVDLYKLLYSGQEEFVFHDDNAPCVRKLAATDVWIHINKRLSVERGVNAPQPPPSIQNQIKFFDDSLKKSDLRYSSAEDERSTYPSFMLPALFNAYSGSVEICDKYLLPALRRVWESEETTPLPVGPVAQNRLRPLPIPFFDALSFHAKMTIHKSLRSLFRAPTSPLPSPAGVDSFARLIAISEPNYVVKLISSELQELLMKGTNIGVLHTFLEMLTFRIPSSNVAFCYRFNNFMQLLKTLSLSIMGGGPNITSVLSNPQLYFLAEQFLLRQIVWTSNNECNEMLFRLQSILGYSRDQSEGHTPIMREHSDLNRVLVLVMARANKMSGSEMTAESMDRLGPQTWPTSTLKLMAPLLSSHIGSHPPMHSREQHFIKQQLDDDYIKWRTLGEESLFEHFTRRGAYPVFLCVLWKYLVDGNKSLPPVSYKILAELKPKVFIMNLHKLLDTLAQDFAKTTDQGHINKMTSSLDQLIWKFWIIPLDRFILSAVMRHYEKQEMHALIWVVRYLILDSASFDQRIKAAHTHLCPEHSWKSVHWFEALKEYYKEVGPMHFWCTGSVSDIFPQLPVYYGHIVQRLVPVMDLLVQKLLEQSDVSNMLEPILDKLAIVFRFHPQPAIFLYNIFSFNYETYLLNEPSRRKKLVMTVLSQTSSGRPANWLLTEEFRLACTSEEWVPSQDYYFNLVNRVIEGVTKPLGPPAWAESDWRLSQFAGPASQAVHTAAIELMASPTHPHIITQSIIRLVLDPLVKRQLLSSTINAIALILTALPSVFHDGLYESIVCSVDNVLAVSGPDATFMCLQSWDLQVGLLTDCMSCRLLALVHAVWHHAPTSFLTKISIFVHDKLTSRVESESQLLFVARLIVPTMQRLFQENPKFSKFIMDMSIDLYEMLLKVDGTTETWVNADTMCDLFYHLKYMYVGDGIKPDSDRIIVQLRPELQNKLRFISHHQKDNQMTTG